MAPAHNLEPPPDSTSSVIKLEWTCRKLGLPQPLYKVHEIRPKRGPPSYDCTVKVNLFYYLCMLCTQVGVFILIDRRQAGADP